MIETSGPTALYVRISDDPKELGLGVKRQEQDCRALAERLGWTVGAVYADNDVSATKPGKTRPAYTRLLADIEAGNVTRLIIDKPDRLYRRNVELEHLIDVVGDRVEIRTVRGGSVDLSTVNGRMVARILGATAQAEVEELKRRVSRKAKELKAAGKWTGGPRPFGWEPDGAGYLRPVPEESKHLKKAAAAILDGSNIHQIALEWRDKGVRGTRGNHAVIADSVLKAMLTADRMEEIIGKDKLAQVRAFLTVRHRAGRKPTAYLVTGETMRCGLCGAPMYGTQTNQGPTYRCAKLVKGGCGKIAIGVEFADTCILEAVSEYLSGYLYPPKVHGVRPNKPRQFAKAQPITEAVAALAKVQAELDELEAGAKAGEISPRLAGKLEPAILVRLKAAQGALRQATADAVGLNELARLDTAAFIANHRKLSLVERRRVVAAVVSRVTVHPHNGAFHVKDYDRVKVEFKPDA